MPKTSFSALSLNDYMDWRTEQVRQGGVKFHQAHPDYSKETSKAWMEQQALPNLEWPKDTYRSMSSIDKEKHCECGCKQNHNNAVSKTIHVEAHGIRGHRIYWFRSLSCRQKWEVSNGK